jgi:uncharacterized Zn-binding protein involved in type VI secretion
MNLGLVSSIAFGTCTCTPIPYPAVGLVISGSPLYMENGLPVATVGSVLIFPCGSSIITTGSVMEFSTGLPVALTGSVVVGCGNGILLGTAPLSYTN